MTGERHGANLPDEVYDVLREIADKRHVTVTPRLRAALDVSDWVDAQVDLQIGVDLTTPQTQEELDRDAFERDWRIHGLGMDHE